MYQIIIYDQFIIFHLYEVLTHFPKSINLFTYPIFSLIPFKPYLFIFLKYQILMFNIIHSNFIIQISINLILSLDADDELIILNYLKLVTSFISSIASLAF